MLIITVLHPVFSLNTFVNISKQHAFCFMKTSRFIYLDYLFCLLLLNVVFLSCVGFFFNYLLFYKIKILKTNAPH